MTTHGAFGHVEWNSTDLGRTKRFYGTLFGWKFRPFGREYLLFQCPGYAGGGFQKVRGRRAVGAGASPTVYVETRNIVALLKKARRLGGRTVQPKTEIPGHGWCAVLRDPDGNRVGLYEEDPAK
jgi:hypothetical protein